MNASVVGVSPEVGKKIRRAADVRQKHNKIKHWRRKNGAVNIKIAWFVTST
jgi:hypothetical protein